MQYQRHDFKTEDSSLMRAYLSSDYFFLAMVCLIYTYRPAYNLLTLSPGLIIQRVRTALIKATRYVLNVICETTPVSSRQIKKLMFNRR